MKLNINPILFEQIFRKTINESDEKMDMARHIFNMIVSPHTHDVGMKYLEFDEYEDIAYLVHQIAEQEFGILLKSTNMNWLELLDQTELDLSENGIEILPESIGNLTNLERLSLGGNQLQTLPESIGNLVNLKWLSLWGNQLQTIPESIGNLVNLKRLSLRDNQLQTLPESIGNLANLEWLSLGGNQLQTLPESIGNLVNLKWLSLWGNQLPQSEKDKIKSLLPNCKIYF